MPKACPNPGCGYKSTVSECEKHKDKCPKLMINCPVNNC